MSTIKLQDSYFEPYISKDKIAEYVAYLADLVSKDLDENTFHK